MHLFDRLFLSNHPELEVVRHREGENGIVLLGYILDPLQPHRTCQDIVTALVESTKNLEDLQERVSSTGGRYVVLATFAGDSFLFSDACGQRQVFYTTEGELWIASESALLAEVLSLEVDHHIRSDFMESPIYAENPERWWPGDFTPYSNVKHLLPNHHLALSTRLPTRFWPSASLRRRTPAESIQQTSQLLQGQFTAMSLRRPMAMAVSAGWDSRILLAASRHVSNRISYFTYTHLELDEAGFDIQIPRALLHRLGLPHRLIRHTEDLPPDFMAYFNRNTTGARWKKALNVYCIFSAFERNEIMVNGNYFDMARVVFRTHPGVPLNGKSLAERYRLQDNGFVAAAFDRWIESAQPVSRDTGIPIPDLFYWEQKCGRWGAMAFSEQDLAAEVFSPFNCRRILESALGVEEKQRKTEKMGISGMRVVFPYHRALAHQMWPEVLALPTRPTSARARIRRTVDRLISLGGRGLRALFSRARRDHPG